VSSEGDEEPELRRGQVDLLCITDHSVRVGLDPQPGTVDDVISRADRGDVDPAQEKPWNLQYIFGWRATSWLVPQALRQCNRELLTVRADLTEMQKSLPKLSVPVVMLHGDHDPLVPVENVAWLEQQLAALGKTNLFAKIILPGVNHFIPWEHPDAVERGVQLLAKMAASQAAQTSIRQ